MRALRRDVFVSRVPDSRSKRSLRRLIAGLMTVIVGSLALSSGSVSAHTGFESSIPGNGATLEEPVATVIVAFTNVASPAGDGFVALDAAGQIRTPTSISVDDDRVFTLTFDPPLAGGTIGVRWSVAAPDAHPIEGSFSFVAPSIAPVETVAPAAIEPEVVVVTETSAPPPAVDETVVAPAVDLDEFLATDNTRPGETTARIGRVVSLISLVIVLGLLVFLATTLVGRRDELRAAFTAVRVLGAGLVVGAVIEYVGVARIAGDGLGSALNSSAGFSMVLRLFGGILLAVGFVPTLTRGRRPAMSLSAAVLEEPVRSRHHDEDPRATAFLREMDPDHAAAGNVRWVPDQSAWVTAVAASLMLVSFSFDGHTVSKGPRVVHALLNTVHVAAGSVWAGGVISMAAILWRRHLLGQPARARELVVRFSGVASLALGAVAVAGLIMSIFVLDSVGELTGTVWGKILLLKTAAVGLACCAGAYNHFKLLPALEADPDDPNLQERIRSSVTSEGILLIFVVIATASLVAAAS